MHRMHYHSHTLHKLANCLQPTTSGGQIVGTLVNLRRQPLRLCPWQYGRFQLTPFVRDLAVGGNAGVGVPRADLGRAFRHIHHKNRPRTNDTTRTFDMFDNYMATVTGTGSLLPAVIRRIPTQQVVKRQKLLFCAHFAAFAGFHLGRIEYDGEKQDKSRIYNKTSRKLDVSVKWLTRPDLDGATCRPKHFFGRPPFLSITGGLKKL